MRPRPRGRRPVTTMADHVPAFLAEGWRSPARGDDAEVRDTTPAGRLIVRGIAASSSWDALARARRPAVGGDLSAGEAIDPDRLLLLLDDDRFAAEHAGPPGTRWSGLPARRRPVHLAREFAPPRVRLASLAGRLKGFRRDRRREGAADPSRARNPGSTRTSLRHLEGSRPAPPGNRASSPADQRWPPSDASRWCRRGVRRGDGLRTHLRRRPARAGARHLGCDQFDTGWPGRSASRSIGCRAGRGRVPVHRAAEIVRLATELWPALAWRDPPDGRGRDRPRRRERWRRPSAGRGPAWPPVGQSSPGSRLLPGADVSASPRNARDPVDAALSGHSRARCSTHRDRSTTARRRSSSHAAGRRLPPERRVDVREHNRRRSRL
jgi:hypothetical protein